MSEAHYGPRTTFAEQLHAQKYRAEGESFRDSMNRVANALKDDDDHYRRLRRILLPQRFMPAGRIQSAMGSPRSTTPYNCYVSGTIEDSFVAGDGSIMQRATEAASTMRMGGGIGYDFSKLRPRGDLIVKLQSRSSGPVSFMDIFDAVCRCTASSGHRRGAQMGVLRIDHPDIEEFVRAKQTLGRLEGFNISVGVTDDFMECLAAGKPFSLRFDGRVYKEVDPVALWEMIMRSTWDWGEPGVLFIDTINRMNNLWYCETIAATNPCGEQPLPPFGACLLGSFNLTKYMERVDLGDMKYAFDYDLLVNDIPDVVRAMDNVVDRARYPLPQQEREAKSKRRMGLGLSGLANAAEALGHPYGSEGFIAFEQEVLRIIRDESYKASAALAKEKGSFEMYDADKYLGGQFIQQLPDDVLFEIQKNGIRNSHLTSIAPTGTISMTADNCSSGIEPVFSYKTERTVIEFGGPKKVVVSDYGLQEFGVRGRQASDVTAQEHLDVLAAAVPFIDSASSKTCNVNGKMDWKAFENLYREAHERGCKGLTTFNSDGLRGGILVEVKPSAEDGNLKDRILELADEQVGESCYLDTATGRRECS